LEKAVIENTFLEAALLSFEGKLVEATEGVFEPLLLWSKGRPRSPNKKHTPEDEPAEFLSHFGFSLYSMGWLVQPPRGSFPMAGVYFYCRRGLLRLFLFPSRPSLLPPSIPLPFSPSSSFPLSDSGGERTGVRILPRAGTSQEWSILPFKVAVELWAKLCQVRRELIEQQWAHTPSRSGAASPPAGLQMSGTFVGEATRVLRAWAADEGFIPKGHNRSQFKAWCHTKYGDLRSVHLYLRLGVLGSRAKDLLEADRADKAEINEAAKRGEYQRMGRMLRDPKDMPKPKASARDPAKDPLAAEAASLRKNIRAAATLRVRLECQLERDDQCEKCNWWGECTECIRCQHVVCWWCKKEPEYLGAPELLLCITCYEQHGDADLTVPVLMPPARPRPGRCEGFQGNVRFCSQVPTAGECFRCHRWLCQSHAHPEQEIVCCRECPRPSQGVPVRAVPDMARFKSRLPPDIRRLVEMSHEDWVSARIECDDKTMRAERHGRRVAPFNEGWELGPPSAVDRVTEVASGSKGRTPYDRHW